MNTQGEFWSDTGPTPEDGTMCGRLLPTPYATMETKYSLKGNTHRAQNISAMARRGELTSSVAGSPAKTYRMLASEQELTGSDLVFGGNLPESSEQSDRDMYLSKTYLPSHLDSTSSNSQLINAYAAGLFDGEGCLTIPEAKNKTASTYTVRIDVGMSSKAIEIMNWLVTNFGGKLRQTRKATDKWDEAMGWSLFGKKAVKFMEAIHPLVILKREQVRLGLLVAEIQAEGWTTENRERCRKIRLRVKELNRKGPQEEHGEGWFARLAAGTWVTKQQDMFADLGLEEYSKTLPRSGSMRNGKLYPQQPVERRISGSGCSLLPTPGAAKSNNDVGLACSGDGRTKPNKLGWAVAMLPTPRSRMTGAASDNRLNDKERNLEKAVSEMGNRGQLNPVFVEYLMNFPKNWTEVVDE